MISFTLNGEPVTVNAAADTPLLWVLREELQLNGSKFGCGAGLCGACSVLIDGRSTRSCVLPIAALDGKAVTTIEGLNGEHPVQQAWIAHSVAQCGYCQSGQIISAVALLEQNPSPSDEQIKTALAGNICRCGTYLRIIKAVHTAAATMAGDGAGDKPAFYDAAAPAGGVAESP